jgi:MFS family permease
MTERPTIIDRLPFYYGWLVFVATFLVYLFMYGLRYSVGVFFVPIQDEFGWTSATTAGALTVFFWVYGVTALFIGRVCEGLGVRRTVALGGLLLGAGGVLASQTSELWHLYVSWGVIAAVGASILYTIPNMVLGRFFLKHRGKAVGWSSIGISVSQAVLVPFAAWVVVQFGWRHAFGLLSVFVILGASLPGYLIFRENPESIGLRMDGVREGLTSPPPPARTADRGWTVRAALRTRPFQLILVSYFFLVGGIVSLLTFVVPHFIQLGIDPLVASTAFSVIGVMSALGSFAFGFVSDRIGRKATIVLTTTGIAASMFVSTVIPPTLLFLYLWVTLYGLMYGGVPEQYAAIVADYFGSRNDIALFGYVMFAGALGGGLFPLIGGYLRDVTGSYYASLLFLGVGMLGALVTVLPLRPVPRASSSEGL